MLSTEDYKDRGRPFAISVNKKNKRKNQMIYLHDRLPPYKGGIALRTKGELEPVPNFKREVIYIAGPSGSGKTSYAGKYLKNFSKMFPENDVYVFSEVDKDPAIDDNVKPDKLHRVVINKELVDDPIDIKNELDDNCLVIFDDTDSFSDKKIQDAIDSIKQKVMETGRHKNIYMVITSHLINPNSKKLGRTIMNEMASMTIFPKAGSAYHTKYALKNYFGMNPGHINDILNNSSRWVTIMKNYPQCVFSENEAYLLSSN